MTETNHKTLIQRKKELLDYQGEYRIIDFEEAKRLSEQSGDVKRIITASLPNFDKTFDGFEESELFVLSGPTGQGKTQMAITLHSAFWRRGVKSLFFTYEVGARNFLKKIPNGIGGFMPIQHKPKDLNWLEERITESQAKYGTFVVFIDHLHYIVPFSQQANFSLLVGQTMQKIKDIARTHRIVIFLVAHLQKTKTEATINDLRDSSFVAQEADGVIMLNRVVERDVWTNKVKVSIFKNRRSGDLKTFICEMKNNEFVELKCESEDLSAAQFSNPLQLPNF